jgi:hypothetical protein
MRSQRWAKIFPLSAQVQAQLSLHWLPLCSRDSAGNPF